MKAVHERILEIQARHYRGNRPRRTGGAVVAWRIDSRSSARQERETRERIQQDVKQSIDKAMSGFKLCPLSDPDCNKR